MSLKSLLFRLNVSHLCLLLTFGGTAWAGAKLKDKEAGLDQLILQFAADSETDPSKSKNPMPSSKESLQGQIPFDLTDRVKMWIRHFSQKDKDRFQRYINRGSPYRNVIEDILYENQAPSELYYLGLIESGFTIKAKSHASAVGIWQFMSHTGQHYKLTINPWVDERLDPIRSTKAAARHLKVLFREFKSWYLALSAYNAGIGRIRKAIKYNRTNDYWKLVRMKALPDETIDYVPKFLAARWIGEHAEDYGFHIPSTSYPDVTLVDVPPKSKLRLLEIKYKIPKGELQFTNPHLIKGRTPPQKKYSKIWVPEPYHLKFASNQDVKSKKTSAKKPTYKQRKRKKIKR